MPTIVLGRDQVITLDGSPLEGVREVSIDVDYKTVDVTSWSDRFASTLPIAMDATVRLLIYGQDEWGMVKAKMDADPPEYVTLGITNGYDVRCVPVSAKIAQPIAGVVAYDVTFKAYSYDQ